MANFGARRRGDLGFGCLGNRGARYGELVANVNHSVLSQGRSPRRSRRPRSNSACEIPTRCRRQRPCAVAVAVDVVLVAFAELGFAAADCGRARNHKNVAEVDRCAGVERIRVDDRGNRGAVVARKVPHGVAATTV